MEIREFSGKNLSEAITNASVSLGITSDQINYEVIEAGSNGFLGIGSKDTVIRVTLEDAVLSPEDLAKAFLYDVFAAMQIEVSVKCKFDDVNNNLDIELEGPEMGVLIGKRGQTLDSLQYLTNLAVNHKSGSYVRVKIDTEDYRRRRKDTLENLAKNMSYKVKRTRRPVSLEAMNPYERRIIHSALQNDQYVVTHSEGEEPYRHVVITLKK